MHHHFERILRQYMLVEDAARLYKMLAENLIDEILNDYTVSTSQPSLPMLPSCEEERRRERTKNNNEGFNTVYVGTEPTVFYRSDDGGESWEKMSSLNNLKSSTSWSFPPRPWTSHIRWIEPDKTTPDYIIAAIEAGALVQS